MNKPIRKSPKKKELIEGYKNKERFLLIIITILVLIISILLVKIYYKN